MDKSVIRFRKIRTFFWWNSEDCCETPEKTYKNMYMIRFEIRVWLSPGCVDWTRLVDKRMCKICWQELREGAVTREPETD